MATKQRRRAQGSYHERAPGVWTVRLSHHGERQSFSVTGSKREAERFLRDKLKQQDEHLVPVKDARKTRFGDFAHDAIARNPKTSPATRERVRALFDRYTSARLRALALADVSRAVLSEERDRLLAQPSQRSKGETPLSPKTVTLVMAAWASVCRIAVKEQRLAVNPMRGIDWPDTQDSTEHGRALTPAETARVLAVEDPWHALWCVLLTLGPRPSEALALQWADINFDTSEVRIERALVRVKGVWKFASTKTRKRRTVPLPLSVTVALTAHQAQQKRERDDAGKGYQDQDLIFADPAGRIVPAWSMKRPWKRVQTAAKVAPPCRLYDCRHTAATRLTETGLDFINIAKILGNSAKQVADRYGHARLEVQREALDRATAPRGPQLVTEAR